MRCDHKKQVKKLTEKDTPAKVVLNKVEKPKDEVVKVDLQKEDKTETILTEDYWQCPHCGTDNHLFMNIPKGYLKSYRTIEVCCTNEQCFKPFSYEHKYDKETETFI